MLNSFLPEMASPGPVMQRETRSGKLYTTLSQLVFPGPAVSWLDKLGNCAQVLNDWPMLEQTGSGKLGLLQCARHFHS